MQANGIPWPSAKENPLKALEVWQQNNEARLNRSHGRPAIKRVDANDELVEVHYGVISVADLV